MISILLGFCFHVPGLAAAQSKDWEYFTDLPTIARDGAVLTVVTAGLFIVSFLIVQRTWPQHENPWALTDFLASVIICPSLFLSALIGAVQLGHDLEMRWHGVTASSRLFMLMYVVWCFVHVFVVLNRKMSPKDLALMLIHHALSIASYSCGLLGGVVHYFGMLDGMSELTNVFLTNVYLYKNITIKDKQLETYLPKWLILINGVCLWLSFIAVRLFIFPYVLYAMYMDGQANWARTWGYLPIYQSCLYICANSFLSIASAVWFVPITKGLLKGVKNWQQSGLKEK